MTIDTKVFDFDAATETFYSYLFNQIPGAKTMFRHIESQQQMFRIALKTVMQNKDDDDMLWSFIAKLGLKHKDFGVQRVHMEIGRDAFLEAMKAGDPNLSKQDLKRLLLIFDKLKNSMGFAPDY